MTKLFVLYDAQCSFCLRCRQWVAAQPTFLTLAFIPFQSPELIARFEGIESFRSKGQLLVVGDDGAVYQGPNAFIMLLYALMDYREWSARLATPALIPFAAQALDLLSSGRQNVLRWLSCLNDGQLLDVLRRQAPPACAEPVCAIKG
jgi:predicted DCC family thiol-disulfide oxidoreductase YuxK